MFDDITPQIISPEQLSEYEFIVPASIHSRLNGSSLAIFTIDSSIRGELFSPNLKLRFTIPSAYAYPIISIDSSINPFPLSSIPLFKISPLVNSINISSLNFGFNNS